MRGGADVVMAAGAPADWSVFWGRESPPTSRGLNRTHGQKKVAAEIEQAKPSQLEYGRGNSRKRSNTSASFS